MLEYFTAVLNDGDTTSHGEYELRYFQVYTGASKPQHHVEAHHPKDGRVGSLRWMGSAPYAIDGMDVHHDHRRKGLATAMWNWAQANARPKPRHSEQRTDMGDAWARSVGGRLPRRRSRRSSSEGLFPTNRGNIMDAGISDYFGGEHGAQAHPGRTAGRGKPRRDRDRQAPPGGGAGGAPAGGEQGEAGEGGGRLEGPRPVEFHPGAHKDLKALDKPVQKQIKGVIDALAAGEQVQTHALSEKLKGWYSTKASRGHRIVHRPTDDGGIHIGYVGLHDYDKAIRRLTHLETLRSCEASSAPQDGREGWPPHQRAVSEAQEAVRLEHPGLTRTVDEESGTEHLRHVLKTFGHPRHEDAFLFIHNGTRNSSNVVMSRETGAPGVALHPSRADYGTLLHEAAHILNDHAHGRTIHEDRGDHFAHGFGFAQQYATLLNHGFGRKSPGGNYRPGPGDLLLNTYYDSLNRNARTASLSHCPCGEAVEYDESDGWQHADGSVSHDGEHYGRSVSDLMKRAAVQPRWYHGSPRELTPGQSLKAGVDSHKPDGDHENIWLSQDPFQAAKYGDVYEVKVQGEPRQPHAGWPEHYLHPSQGEVTVHRRIGDPNDAPVDATGSPKIKFESSPSGSHHRVFAEHGGRMVGNLGWEEGGEVMGDWVHPDYRDSGLRERMLKHVQRKGVLPPRMAAHPRPTSRIFGPTYGLDHRLFEGEHLKPEVRTAVMSRLGPVIEPLLGQDWQRYVRVYLAGSEASEWTSEALEGNGDFDTLLGIDYDALKGEPGIPLAVLDDDEINARLNKALREQYNADHLWYVVKDVAWLHAQNFNQKSLQNSSGVTARKTSPSPTLPTISDAVSPPSAGTSISTASLGTCVAGDEPMSDASFSRAASAGSLVTSPGESAPSAERSTTTGTTSSRRWESRMSDTRNSRRSAAESAEGLTSYFTWTTITAAALDASPAESASEVSSVSDTIADSEPSESNSLGPLWSTSAEPPETPDGYVAVGPFEVTGYVNADSWDIKKIKPYAAYNITDDTWSVRPPHLPDWSLEKFPEGGENLLAEAEGYAAVVEAISQMPEPFQTQQGKALWKHLHSDRGRAFSDEGEGWTDPGNAIEKILVEWGVWDKLVEWQYGKKKMAKIAAYFHGTNQIMEPGDQVTPGHPSVWEHSSPEHVYFVDDADAADGFAETASMRHGGDPHVYQVEPIGPHEDDPELEDDDTGLGSYRSRHPLRVVRKVSGVQATAGTQGGLPEGLTFEHRPPSRRYPDVHHAPEQERTDEGAAWIRSAGSSQAVEHVLIDKLFPHREWQHQRGGYSYDMEGEGPYAPKHDAAGWDENVSSVRDGGVREPLTLHYNPRQHAAYLGEGNHRLHWAREAGHTTVPVRMWRTTTSMPERYNLAGEPRLTKDEHGYFPQDGFKPSDVLPEDYFPARKTASWENREINGIYRGMGVDLPKDLHAYVHDASIPRQQRAQRLLEHVSAAPFGMHWTDDPDVARGFASRAARKEHLDEPDEHSTPVVVHAGGPELEHIETDRRTLRKRRVRSYDDDKDAESEVPIKSGAPVNVVAVSWADPSSYRGGRHKFHRSYLDEAVQKTAGQEAHERARAYVQSRFDQDPEDYPVDPHEAPDELLDDHDRHRDDALMAVEGLGDAEEGDLHEALHRHSRFPMYIATHHPGNILTHGRMKTLSEMGDLGKGREYIDYRNAYERHIMGVDPHLPAHERPIYGMATRHADTGYGYGDYHLELKPHVRSRTTATFGDSLNHTLHPYGIDDLHHLRDEPHRLHAVASDAMVRAASSGLPVPDYMEFQVHGGVDLSDIARIHVHGKATGQKAAVMKLARSHGIEAVHHPYDEHEDHWMNHDPDYKQEAMQDRREEMHRMVERHGARQTRLRLGEDSYAFHRPGMRSHDPIQIVGPHGVQETTWGALVARSNGEVLHQLPDEGGARTAGAKGDLPEGISYEHELKDDGIHTLFARHSDMPENGFAGVLSWWDSDGEVGGVEVHPQMQRRGLGTELYRRAKEITPHLHHSDYLTPEAEQWISGMEKNAGAGGGLPELTFRHLPPEDNHAYGGAEQDTHTLHAHLPDGARAGELSWFGEDGMIRDVDVPEHLRRRGIASALLRRAREIQPDVHHSESLTSDGQAWSERTAMLEYFTAADDDDDDDYRLMHRAPDENSGKPLHEYQGGHPDELVRIYRSVPKNVDYFDTDTWATTDPDYAHMHGRDSHDPAKDWPVISAEVPQKHVYWDENDSNEVGYQGPRLESHRIDLHDEETGEHRPYEPPAGWSEGAEDRGGDFFHGMGVHLPPEDHAFVHNTRNPKAERAHRLFAHVPERIRENGTPNWTDDADEADMDTYDEDRHQHADVHDTPLTRVIVHGSQNLEHAHGVSWASDDDDPVNFDDYHHHEFEGDPNERLRKRSMSGYFRAAA